MTSFRPLAALALAVAAFVALPACSGPCEPRLADGWVRLTPVAMPMSAGFGTIENPCAEPITVVAVSSPSFADVSLHETTLVDGISRMRPVEQLPVPAGGAVGLEPGGLHLMLTQPTAALVPGERVEVEFRLADGTTLRGQLQVRQPGG